MTRVVRHAFSVPWGVNKVADIELNPRVADRFVHLDWRDEKDDPEGFRTTLMQRYEAGDVLILRNAPFQIDLDLLNRVSLPSGKQFQKLADTTFRVTSLCRADPRKVFRAAFGNDVLLYLRFRREVDRVSACLRDFARDVFRPYRYLKQGVSWRFTKTTQEGLHVDYFRKDEDLHYVRIFINVDKQPRVWTLSHSLEELIRRHYDEAGLGEVRHAPSNKVCSRLNKRVFDPMNKYAPGTMDRHFAHFAPGDVWLCETRLNSHEIYSGHRMVATGFYVDPTSMLNPAERVDARVQRALEAAGGVAERSAAAGEPGR